MHFFVPASATLYLMLHQLQCVHYLCTSYTVFIISVPTAVYVLSLSQLQCMCIVTVPAMSYALSLSKLQCVSSVPKQATVYVLSLFQLQCLYCPYTRNSVCVVPVPDTVYVLSLYQLRHTAPNDTFYMMPLYR